MRRNNFIENARSGRQLYFGLGGDCTQNRNIDEWKINAKMDWEVLESPVLFNRHGAGIQTDESRKVLYRSDNSEVLSVMSSDYKVVQPGEILEFFRDLVEDHGLFLETAGTFFGGKRYFALANTGKSSNIVLDDEVQGKLLLVTSADGTVATIAKFTSLRIACWNSLLVALKEESKRQVMRCTHAKEFDARQFKIDLGLIDTQWDAFITNLRSLADKKVQDSQAMSFFQKLVNPSAANELQMGQQRKLDALLHFYKAGAGAEYSHGTAWGLLNAVTELETHGTGRSDPSWQFNKSEMGAGANTKQLALEMLLEASF